MEGWKGESGGHFGSSTSTGILEGGRFSAARDRVWTAFARHTSVYPHARDILQSSDVKELTVFDRFGRLSPASKTSRAANQ